MGLLIMPILTSTLIKPMTSGSIAPVKNCLFRFLNGGFCPNGLPASPNYLDLGGALAAFGLIFAVYQLRKSDWDAVLKIRSNWQKNLFWIFGGVALLMSLLRVVATQIPLAYLAYPFNVPLFYEITAYLFFIASPLSLMILATRKKKLFTSKNARKFYEVMILEVAKANDERLNAALEILLHNFEDICKAAAEESNGEMNGAARAILDVILSEESMVRLLTTKRIDALQHILTMVKKYHINRQDSGVGIPKIVGNLFSEKESFFYKQLDRTGFALSSNVYDAIFKSPEMLANFDLFGFPTLDYSMRAGFRQSGIKVFIKALSEAIETYLKTGQVSARNINNGISYLSDIFGDVCLKLSMEEQRGSDTRYTYKDDWQLLHDIAYFLGHDYIFIGNDEQLNTGIIDREKTVPEADFFSYQTINAGIAAALFKAFEQLSFLSKTTDTYYTVLDLLNGMTYQSGTREGYREPFTKRMWEQIGHNVAERYYPAALRTYLVFIGFCLASTNARTGWIGEQTERMRRLLYIDLKTLLDNQEKMVDGTPMIEALLPDSMGYANNEFTYTSGFGKGTKTVIASPPAGATSALQGVDLNNSESLL